jgi:pimeloyl-ACP methyl ester carboxylesterase
VNANLWRNVVAELSAEFRCIALDLPLGSHTIPMPADADLTPHGLADLIAETIEALSLDDVTLVGYFTGGALCPDLKRVVKAIDARYSNEAADRLREFEKPALIAWLRDDRFFKPEHAERLAQDIPDARLEWIDKARSLSPEDAPARLAELIAAFARETASRATV